MADRVDKTETDNPPPDSSPVPARPRTAGGIGAQLPDVRPSAAGRMSESGRAHPRGPWVLDVFRPLPEDEAELWRDYGV